MPRHRAVAIALTALALAFRVWLALAHPNDAPDDGQLYSALARNVVLHGVYSQDDEEPFSPTYIRVPGYPLFLAGFYVVFGVGHHTGVRVAQAVLDVVACWVIAWLALTWSPGEWPPERRRQAGLIGLALAALCPFTAVYATTILTEGLAVLLGTAGTALGTCALLALDRPASRRELMAWFAAGVVGAAAALVRPDSGLVTGANGVALLLFAWLRVGGLSASAVRAWLHRVVPAGLALTIGFALPIAPWAVRNYLVIGVFQPLNPETLAMPGEFVPLGYAAWVRSWIHDPEDVGPALFALDRSPILANALPADAYDSPDEKARVTALLDCYNAPVPDPEASPEAPRLRAPGGMTPAIDAGFRAIAAERARRHPFRHYVRLPLERLLAMWFAPHADFYWFEGLLFPLEDLDWDLHQEIYLPLFLGLTFAWTIAGWVGAWRMALSPASRRWLLLVAVLVVPRLVLLASLENPEPRYMVEFVPVMTALAATALAAARRPDPQSANGNPQSAIHIPQ